MSTQAYLCVFGGILVHLTLGTFYTFGNMLPYLASYIASQNGGDDRYHDYVSDCVWIYTLMAMGQAIAIPTGGKLEQYVGPKNTILLGSFIMSFSVFLTHYTVGNLVLTILSYGFCFGFGLGIAYSTPLVVGMRWFPNYKGRVNGCIVMGFGAASTIFIMVQTELVNPNNIPSDPTFGFTKQESILNNIPEVFIKLSLIYTAMQLVGTMMISNPPDYKHKYLLAFPSQCLKSRKSPAVTDRLLPNSQLEMSINDGDKAGADSPSSDSPEVMVKAGDALRDPTFWNLWFTFCLNALALTFVSTSWKNFTDVQLDIHDDKFLATMGAISSVFNGLGRLFWASILDWNKSYKITMGCMTSLFSFFLATWPLVTHLNAISETLEDIIAVIWLCALFFSICGIFSVFPTQITNVYGPSNNGVIYGLLFTAMFPSCIIASFGVVFIQKAFNWYFTSWAFALCGVASFCLTMRSSDKSQVISINPVDGKEIK